MNLYTEFLVAFMLVFAVGYTLAYLPGMLKMKAIYAEFNLQMQQNSD